MSRLGKTGSAEVLSDQDLKIVLRVITSSDARGCVRNVAIVILSHYLALRAKELASLKVRDVYDGKKIVDVLRLLASYTKGKKHRDVSLTNKRVRDALENLITELKHQDGERFSLDSALFRSQKRGHFSANTIVQLLKNIYVSAGFKNASSHSGRRSLITKLADKGVSVNDIRLIAGHSSIATTQRYIQENPNKIANIMGAI